MPNFFLPFAFAVCRLPFADCRLLLLIANCQLPIDYGSFSL